MIKGIIPFGLFPPQLLKMKQKRSKSLKWEINYLCLNFGILCKEVLIELSMCVLYGKVLVFDPKLNQ